MRPELIVSLLLALIALLLGWIAVARTRRTLPFRSAGIRFGIALHDRTAWQEAHAVAAPYFGGGVVLMALAAGVVWLPLGRQAVGAIVLGLGAGAVGVLGIGAAVGNRAAERVHHRPPGSARRT